MSSSDDFNIVRFTKFMNDLEQGKVPEYNKSIIRENNFKQFIDMLDKTVINESSAFAAELGKVSSDAANSLGKTLKGLGFGLAGMTKDALSKLDFDLFNDMKSKRKYAKATKELFNSYKDELYAVIEGYAKEFEVFSNEFFQDVLRVLSVDEFQEEHFLDYNKRTLIDLRKEANELKKVIKQAMPEEYRKKKYSIKEYMLAVKLQKRPVEFSEAIGKYKSWVERSVKEKFFPMIKDFSSFIMIEYIKQKNQQPTTTPKTKKVSEQIQLVSEIYNLFENLDEDSKE